MGDNKQFYIVTYQHQKRIAAHKERIVYDSMWSDYGKNSNFPTCAFFSLESTPRCIEYIQGHSVDDIKNISITSTKDLFQKPLLKQNISIKELKRLGRQKTSMNFKYGCYGFSIIDKTNNIFFLVLLRGIAFSETMMSKNKNSTEIIAGSEFQKEVWNLLIIYVSTDIIMLVAQYLYVHVRCDI